jgi:hypothetical protein
MPLAVLNRIVFHQDGATPHNARIHVAFLNDNFGARWMGTYGPIRWPARSPDLNPLDFFLWGYIRDNVYLTPPGTREELRRKVYFASLTCVFYLRHSSNWNPHRLHSEPFSAKRKTQRRAPPIR